ncbi:hypothetical protein CTI14_68930, partial [Methylobacterium radiotolerans]
KTALLALMAVFLAGNLGCALAPSRSPPDGRADSDAFAHGAFFGIGKTALLALMAVFLAGNLGCALAPSRSPPDGRAD